MSFSASPLLIRIEPIPCLSHHISYWANPCTICVSRHSGKKFRRRERRTFHRPTTTIEERRTPRCTRINCWRLPTIFTSRAVQRRKSGFVFNWTQPVCWKRQGYQPWSKNPKPLAARCKSSRRVIGNDCVMSPLFYRSIINTIVTSNNKDTTTTHDGYPLFAGESSFVRYISQCGHR